MLEVGMQTTIHTLFKKGYSKAKICRELGVSPKTVRKVLKSMEQGECEIQKKPHPSVPMCQNGCRGPLKKVQ